MSWRGLLVLLLMMVSASAHAKRFRNAYLSFELPPNWNCKLEGSEWVCENDFAGKTKESIIILTAKEVGPADSLAAYMAHLQTPRTLPGRGGVPTKSQIISVKERMIGNQMWIDGMHLGSEVGPYFTRYLATIKNKLSILVTFSAHKEHYTKYSNDFIKAVESLRVVAGPDIVGDGGATDATVKGGGGIIGQAGQGPTPYDPNALLPSEENGAGQHKGGKLGSLLLLALVLSAAGAFFYLRGKKKKGKKPAGKKPTKKA